jgi:non-heme chloroperoxidase
MNPSNITPLNTAPVDKDLIEQAHPGHGVPSQDPASAAQFLLQPEEAEREAKSVVVGGGAVAGAATGAAIGVAVGGPVGVVVGVAVGAVAGALGAAAVGTMLTPENSSSADTSPADTMPVHTEGSAGGGQPAGLGPGATRVLPKRAP